MDEPRRIRAPSDAARVDFVLVRPSHPGNIGACARAMRVMGFDRLVLVAPRVLDASSQPEAIAFASGADAVLRSARTVTNLDEALAGCTLAIALSASGREFVESVLTPEQAADAVCAELARSVDARVAVVFGTERTGLSVGEAQRCQHLCRIPGSAEYRSLNLAQAVQIVAYLLRRVLERLPEPCADTPRPNTAADLPATLAQVESMLSHLERMLVAIGFLDPARPKRLMPRLRRMFGRARPSREEIDIVRGICSRVERLNESAATVRRNRA